jgi:hypothetical protein
VEQIRHAIRRSKPYGSEGWVNKTVAQFGLEKTVRDRCRPGKGTWPWKGYLEDVKKSIQSVILSAAKNLQLFVFKKLTADASLLLSMTAYFFTPSCPPFLPAKNPAAWMPWNYRQTLQQADRSQDPA